MAKLSTFRDVMNDRTTKLTAQDPVGATQQFIKFDQPWPINKEKDEKDSPPSKKQKTDKEQSADRTRALDQISDKHAFSTEKYISVSLVKRKEVNDDVRIYTFKHPLNSIKDFNLGIGQHIQCAFVLKDGEIVERPYAIVRPTGADEDDGTIDILVKTALPSEKDPGGTVSNILDCLDEKRHDEMLIRGPEGPISYLGMGKFSISVDGKDTKQVSAKRVNFISGGTGMTPIYATIRYILEAEDGKDSIDIRFMDANANKKDVLMGDHLDELHEKHDRFKIIHVLEKPDGDSTAEEGMIDKEKMEKHLFPAEEGTISLVCGPPPMMKVAKEGLEALGYKDGTTFFHY